MGKLVKKVFVFLLVCGIIYARFTSVWAAEKEYAYTVRFFAGAQGTIHGKETVVCENLHYGDRVTFNQNMVRLNNNSKYYIKGIRESGRDNNTVNNTASFPVTGDMDYVVVYGILGNAVAYTVNYQDERGNALAESETYYGNVGDAPVIAFLYIEGWQPQAYNQTMTLKENAAENVFTFVYTPVDASQAGQTPENQTQPAQGPTVTPAAGTQGAGTAGAGTAGTDGNEGAAGDGGNEGAQDDTLTIPDEDVPQDLLNLDDGDTPLANTKLGGGANGVVIPTEFAVYLFNLPLAAKVGIFSSFLLAGGGGWYLFGLKKRKKEKADE